MLKSLWESVRRVAMVAPVAIVFNDSVASMCGIKGRSMQPTLNPDGFLLSDRVVMEKLSTRRYKFNRGDVLVFRSPEEPGMYLVKRLIGLQGDWISVPGSNSVRQIPKGHIWVEGDNTTLSSDSNHFGPIPLGLVEGRVTHIIWPPMRVGRVESKLPHGRVLLPRKL